MPFKWKDKDTRIYSHKPTDIEPALNILEDYRKRTLEEGPRIRKDLESLEKFSQRKLAIDMLEDYLIDRAFEAPVVILIEDFINRMNIMMAESGEGTKVYTLYKNIRDTAYDIGGYFL